MAIALLGVAFAAAVGAVVFTTVFDDRSSPSDAPAAQVNSPVAAEVDVEPAPPSGRVARLMAGFVLIVGWLIGVLVTIVRARRRQRSPSGHEVVA